MAYPVEMELAGRKIILKLANRDYDVYAESIAGKYTNEELGVYQYSLSFQNLSKINTIFDGKGLPKVQIVAGQHILDRMRNDYREYQNRKSRLRDIMKTERMPVEPNGKFVPYAHQTKIVNVIQADPFTPCFSDCGTGKTGSVARSVELILAEKSISPGKTLVSAPLSILATSWVDDIKQFTNLKYRVLWTPMSNKIKKIGEKRIIGHGVPEKPAETLTVKSKKGQRWVKGNIIKEGKLNIFDEAEGPWEKMSVSWKEAILPDGTTVTFGPIYGTLVETENTKENWIREQLADPNVDIFIINHDGVRIYETVLKEHNFEWVIVDESTKIKSSTSKITKAHWEISWGCKRRTIMTGTPNPNGFVDLWSQFYFLDRGQTLFTSFVDFRKEFFTPIKVGHFQNQDAFKWELTNPERREALIRLVKDNAIFLDQRDCIDLPERVDLSREVFMTAEQSRVYRKMEEELVAELLDKRTGMNVQVEAKNTLSKLMKLRQITSGFVGHAEGVTRIEAMDDNPKYEELDAFLEEIPGKKLVIACQFKEEIYALRERYKNRGVGAIFGEEKVESRNDFIRRFQNTDEINIMLLQPQAAAHGITLTKAQYFVFFSLDYNFEFYYQTGKRIERLGQKERMFVYHLLAKTDSGRQTIDHDLMDVLKSKSKDRDVLFKESVDNVEIAERLRQRLIQRVQETKSGES